MPWPLGKPGWRRKVMTNAESCRLWYLNHEKKGRRITHCKHGHKLNARNCRFTKLGTRQCRVCCTLRERASKRARRMGGPPLRTLRIVSESRQARWARWNRMLMRLSEEAIWFREQYQQPIPEFLWEGDNERAGTRTDIDGRRDKVSRQQRRSPKHRVSRVAVS